MLIKAVEKHTEVPWEILYIKRWIKAPLKSSNSCTYRKCGVPQGGVISPVLANLFLHYTFDKWMERNFPNNPWCRYADDGIVHCKTLKQAQYIMKCLDKRLKECKLQMHPDKTKIIYCKDSNRTENYDNIEFTFLSYTFRPRKAKGKNNKQFTSFLPAISNKAKSHIKQTIKEWRLLWMTNKGITEIAEKYNPIIRGWLNYYGRYGKKELARVLEHINYHLYFWIKRKYKKYKFKSHKAMKCLRKIADKNPILFQHWKVGILPMTR